MNWKQRFGVSGSTIALLGFLLLFAVVVRFAHGDEIEFKHDQAETMWYIERFRTGEYSWPWIGQHASSGLRHPAFGIWLYLVPGLAFGLDSPVEVARITQIFAVLALGLLLWFALFRVKASERPFWLWTYAIACVNPLGLLLERKIWHPSLLPFFVMLMISAWWVRERRWSGAFLWGLVGALIGQIHMGGFYFALTLIAWTFFLDKRRKSIPWKHWFAGSCIGALPLLPWLWWVAMDSHTSQPLDFKLHRLFMFRYWTYWIRNGFGWNSKYPLGREVDMFYSWPLVGGKPTYLIGLAHLVLVALTAYLVYLLGRWLWQNRGKIIAKVTAHESDTRFLLNAAFVGCGVFVTLSILNVTRYFHIVMYPLPYLFLAYVFLKKSKWPRQVLATIVVSQMFISGWFIRYIHVRQKTESIKGDYYAPWSFQERSWNPKNNPPPKRSTDDE